MIQWQGNQTTRCMETGVVGAGTRPGHLHIVVYTELTQRALNIPRPMSQSDQRRLGQAWIYQEKYRANDS